MAWLNLAEELAEEFGRLEGCGGIGGGYTLVRDWPAYRAQARAQMQAKDARYRASHAGQRRESNRAYRAADPEYHRSRVSAWKAENQDRVREARRRYREKQKAKTGVL